MATHSLMVALSLVQIMDKASKDPHGWVTIHAAAPTSMHEAAGKLVAAGYLTVQAEKMNDAGAVYQTTYALTDEGREYMAEVGETT